MTTLRQMAQFFENMPLPRWGDWLGGACLTVIIVGLLWASVLGG